MKDQIIKAVGVCAVVLFLSMACSQPEDKPTATGSRMPDKYAMRDSVSPAISLDALLQPTNAYAISSVPVTTINMRSESIEVPALGAVQYDLRQAGAVSARIAGRIEKLYVRYRYQHIQKGEKVLEIYSPELLTSQQNFIFLLQNDPANRSLIDAAKQRLLLLGMTSGQLEQVARTGKPIYSVSVYSNYSGYVTDINSSNMLTANTNAPGINSSGIFPQTTGELSLKEGMYLDAGQTIFNVINTNTAIVSLSINSADQNLVKVGDPVTIAAETTQDSIRSTIDYIEPYYSGATRSLTARVYINNAAEKIPIGSQVQATIFTGDKKAAWLPAGAVLTLGLNDIVFLKEGQLFKAQKISVGTRLNDQVQVLSGLSPTDSVVVNAQYLVENESFIRLNQ